MDENDNQSRFSASKVLPATLLTLFEAQGRLDVSEPVGRYLPAAVGTI